MQLSDEWVFNNNSFLAFFECLKKSYLIEFSTSLMRKLVLSIVQYQSSTSDKMFIRSQSSILQCKSSLLVKWSKWWVSLSINLIPCWVNFFMCYMFHFPKLRMLKERVPLFWRWDNQSMSKEQITEKKELFK